MNRFHWNLLDSFIFYMVYFDMLFLKAMDLSGAKCEYKRDLIENKILQGISIVCFSHLIIFIAQCDSGHIKFKSMCMELKNLVIFIYLFI